MVEEEDVKLVVVIRNANNKKIGVDNAKEVVVSVEFAVVIVVVVVVVLVAVTATKNSIS